MAETEKIILFEGDVMLDEAIKETIRYEDEVTKLKEELKALQESENKSEEAIVKKTLQIKVAQKELNNHRNITQKVIQANNDNTGSISQLRLQLAVVSERWAKLSAEERKNSELGKSLSDEKLRLTNALKEEEKATGDARRNVGNYEEAIIPLKQQLKEVTMQMQQMVLDGKDSGVEFEELAKKAGKLKDAMNATNDQVKSFTAGDKMELSLKATKGGFDAVIGGAQAYEGAIQSLGFGNEDVTKGIQKLVALQSIQNGVTQVYESLQKESALIMGLNTIKTKAASAAQLVYTTAVGTSTGALKAFRVALLATGIGALIVALGLVVANWSKISSAIDGSAAAQKKYNLELERLQQLKQANIEFDNLSLEIKKELGFKDSDITKQEIENSKKRQNEINKEIELTSAKKKKTDEEIKSQKDRYDELIKIQDEQILLEIRLNKQLQEEKNKQQEESNKKQKELRDKIFDEITKELEDDAKFQEEKDKEDKDREEQKLKEDAERQKEMLQRRIDSIKQEQKAKEEYDEWDRNRQIIDLDNRLAIENEYSDAYFDLLQQKNEKEYQEEILNAEKTGADVTLIFQKYEKAKQEIEFKRYLNSLSLYSQFAGNIATIAGKNTKVGKMAASAQTAIDTYTGAISAYKSLAGIPYVGPVLGAAAAAAVGVAGAKAIQNIWAVKSGLPGDGGGGTSTGSTAPSGGASVNPSIGQGIVSRSVNQTTNEVKVTTQPTLVVDDVTNAQQTKERILKTQSI